jgi:MFS family permease
MHDLTVAYGFGEARAGLIVSLEMGAIALGSAFAAKFVPPRGLAAAAVAGAVVAAAASLFSLGAASFMLLMLLRAFVGLGAGANLAMANSVAATAPDPDRTFGHIGVINILFGAILVAAVPFVHRLSVAPVPFFTLFLFLVLLLPTVAAFSLRPTAARDAALGAHQAGSPRSGAAREILLLTSATVAIGLASGIMWAFYGLIGAAAGLSIHAVETAISVAILTAAGGAALAVLIGRRFGRMLPMSAGLMVMAASIAALSFEPDAPMFRIATCANVASLYFLMPYLYGAAAARDPSGKGAAYVGSAFFFTGAISPAIGGLLAQTIGMTVVGTAAIISVLPVMGLLALVCREPDKAPQSSRAAPATGI